MLPVSYKGFRISIKFSVKAGDVVQIHQGLRDSSVVDPWEEFHGCSRAGSVGHATAVAPDSGTTENGHVGGNPCQHWRFRDRVRADCNESREIVRILRIVFVEKVLNLCGLRATLSRDTTNPLHGRDQGRDSRPWEKTPTRMVMTFRHHAHPSLPS